MFSLHDCQVVLLVTWFAFRKKFEKQKKIYYVLLKGLKIMQDFGAV